MHNHPVLKLAAELQHSGGEFFSKNREFVAYRVTRNTYPLDESHNSCFTLGAYKLGGRMNAKGVQPPLYTASSYITAGLESISKDSLCTVLKHSNHLTYDTLSGVVNQLLFPSRDLTNNDYLLYRLIFTAPFTLNLLNGNHAPRILSDNYHHQFSKSDDLIFKSCIANKVLPSSYAARLGLASFFSGVGALIRPSAKIRWANRIMRHKGLYLEPSAHYAIDVFCPFVEGEIKIEGPLDPREL